MFREKVRHIRTAGLYVQMPPYSCIYLVSTDTIEHFLLSAVSSHRPRFNPN